MSKPAVIGENLHKNHGHGAPSTSIDDAMQGGMG